MHIGSGLYASIHTPSTCVNVPCMPQAWLRARGEAGSTLFTAETVAEQFGVARNSYDAVQLPYRDVLQVRQAGNLRAGASRAGARYECHAGGPCAPHAFERKTIAFADSTTRLQLPLPPVTCPCAVSQPQCHVSSFVRSSGNVPALGTIPTATLSLLPCRTRAVQVQCHGSGAPQEVLSLEPATLPPQLEWGQVLVAWRCAGPATGMRTSRLYQRLTALIACRTRPFSGELAQYASLPVPRPLLMVKLAGLCPSTPLTCTPPASAGCTAATRRPACPTWRDTTAWVSWPR